MFQNSLAVCTVSYVFCIKIIFSAGVSFLLQELGGAVPVKRACVLDGSLKSSKLNQPKTFKVGRSSGVYINAWHMLVLRMPLKYGDSYELVNIHVCALSKCRPLIFNKINPAYTVYVGILACTGYVGIGLGT